MRIRSWFVIAGTALAIMAGWSIYPQSSSGKSTGMPQAVAFRILLGLTDQQATDWSGSVSASSGRIEVVTSSCTFCTSS